jgi:hypothetical protein
MDLRDNEELTLERDENNKYDENAIEIFTPSGDSLGYISAVLAKKLAPIMDNGIKVECFISEITGFEDGKTGGCNIRIEVFE